MRKSPDLDHHGMKRVASIIMAAGRGSRMTGFQGNKTLLPLKPGRSVYEGSHTMLLHILRNLPEGPKAVVVHHKKQDVMEKTRGMGLTYCVQKHLNGTGGALLAARPFIQEQQCTRLIITMGDVPLVKKETYVSLLGKLDSNSLVVLGFRPRSKRQYGVLEMVHGKVRKITEWKYWKDYPEERRAALQICNSGIYAAKKADLLPYLSVLASRPHKLHKEIKGKLTEVEEFFITDLIQYMYEAGLSIGCVVAEDEWEVMGVDDLPALNKVQEIFRVKETTSG
jgi:bifunctional UDP-N-acetylglucosamine pyrophosphorylase/glucosamine-1-phosphate N-acetyltransferase